MELAVYWTQFAEDKLTDIYEYYKFNAGIRVAQNLINGIIDESLKLGKNPFIGQKEDLLCDRLQEYRYLVFKN
jgi:plasmid stabilization system protein ParE